MAYQDEKSPLLPKGEKNTSSDKDESFGGCLVSLRRFLSKVTVEPAMLLHSISYEVEGVFTTNMLVDKICKNQLHYSDDVCANLDSGRYPMEQDKVQQITNEYNMYSDWIEMAPSFIMLIFLGAWSDKRGRRLPLLLPMIGSTLKALGLIFNAYRWSLPPYFMLFSYIPYGLSGSMITAFMAAYAFIGDECGEESRTTRISMVGITMYAFSPIGHMLGAFLFKYYGYVAVFGTEFVISTLSVLYILLRLDDTPAQQTSSVGSVFSLGSVKDTFRVVFKKRENHGRLQILGHIACISLYMFSFGASMFNFLYTRKKFGWDYFTYTIWSTVSSPVSLFGTCVVLPIMSMRLGVDDSVIAFTSCVAHIFYFVIFATAPVSWLLFLSVVITGVTPMAISCSRSALSKIVSRQELGAVFSVIGMGEALLPLVGIPLFTVIYNSTLEIFPGTVYIIGAVFNTIIAAMYAWLSGFNTLQAAKLVGGEV